MPVQQIIEAMEQLLSIHTSLLDISKQKTSVVKAGNMKDLQPLLIRERSYVQKLKQADNSREQAVQNWALNQSMPQEETTISTILKHIAGMESRDQLAEVTTKLTNTITVLKQQEALNRSLIEQSLRFVDMSLDLLNPSISQFNYGATKQTDRRRQQPLFDSKA